MATLKGAYQRFVTSIIRLWKREEETEEIKPTEDTEEATSSSAELLLSDDEEPIEDNNNSDSFLSPSNHQEPSHSAPDLLEESLQKSPARSPDPVKKKKSSLRRGLSVLKRTTNKSDSDLAGTSSQPLLRPRNHSSPVLFRKSSANSSQRPVTIVVERPAYLKLQPPTPDSSRESSPTLFRREFSDSNLLHDHPPAVIRRNLGQSRFLPTPSPTQIRREKSTLNLFKSSPRTHPPRKPRPKSVSEFLTSEYQTEKTGKLTKTSSFFKVSPSLFRKHSPKSPDISEEPKKDFLKLPNEPEEQKLKDKQSGQRTRTFTLATKFSKFASKRIDGTLRRRTKTDARSLKITVMQKIDTSTENFMPVEPFLARLRDYNTYYDDRPALQFKWKQDKDGNHVVDGMLNIYWGLKRAIRLQMQDKGVKIRPQSSLAFAQAEAVRRFEETTTGMPLKEETVDIVLNNEKLSGTIMRRRLSKAVEDTKNGGDADSIISIENGILGETRQRNYDRRRMALRLKNGGEKVHVSTQDEDGLLRQRSVILRKKLSKSGRARFSINGHAYNYQTSVFTPAYASVTNVRVTSKSSCDDVIKYLLNKFRVENTFEEFSLYLVKESGERRELPRNEYPLVTRILSGPNEQVCKLFVMDRNMHEDISSEVAQYIQLDMNILTIFVKKFTEEEERETTKMKERYEFYRKMLQKRIKEISET